MKKVGLLIGLLLIASPCFADQLCAHALQTAVINVSSATTTKIATVGTLTTNRIVVCGFDFTVAGTTPTLQLEGGTGSTCGTSTVAITGTYAPTAGTFLHAGEANAMVASTASGSDLCLVSGGTPSIQGVLQYVIVP